MGSATTSTGRRVSGPRRGAVRCAVAISVAALAIVGPVRGPGAGAAGSGGSFVGEVAAGSWRGVQGSVDFAGLVAGEPGFSLRYYTCASTNAVVAPEGSWSGNLVCGAGEAGPSAHRGVPDELAGTYSVEPSGVGFALEAALYDSYGGYGSYHLACDVVTDAVGGTEVGACSFA